MFHPIAYIDFLAVPRRRYPAPSKVSEVLIFPGALGFRYSCRGHDGVTIYDSPRSFRSRFDAKKEIRRRFPHVKVLFS